MKVNMNGEEFSKGVGEFMKVYYKESMGSKSVKDLIVIFCVSVFFMLTIGLISPDLRGSMFTLLIILGVGALLIFMIIFITALIAKKKKNNIKEVEYVFEDKIYANCVIGEGSVSKEQYNYDNIEKVVETKDYFYVFVSKYAALTVKKKDSLNREEFIEFMIDKRILVKEFK